MSPPVYKPPSLYHPIMPPKYVTQLTSRIKGPPNITPPYIIPVYTPPPYIRSLISAIADIRKSKKRPSNKSIPEFIQKNHSTNANFNFIEKAIEKLIKNKKIVNKPAIQNMTSYFPISNYKLNENKVTESEPIFPGISTSPL